MTTKYLRVKKEVESGKALADAVDRCYLALEKRKYAFKLEAYVCLNTWMQVDKRIDFMYANKLDLKNLQP